MVFDTEAALTSSHNVRGIAYKNWVTVGSRHECTGIITRACSAGLGGANIYANVPPDVARWVHQKGGNAYYNEVDPETVIANPQIGDILIYKSPTKGSSTTVSATQKNYKWYSSGNFHIGHTTMWLPNVKTMGDGVWCSDFIQYGKWYVYPGHPMQYLRAFRLKIQYKWKGQTYNPVKTPAIPDGGETSGLSGDASNLKAAKSSTGDIGASATGGSSTADGASASALTAPSTPSQPAEVIDPNKDAGKVLESSYKNAYSNILGIDGVDTTVRTVKHTRIYALFKSTIVLDEMSHSAEFLSNDISESKEKLEKELEKLENKEPTQLEEVTVMGVKGGTVKESHTDEEPDPSANDPNKPVNPDDNSNSVATITLDDIDGNEFYDYETYFNDSSVQTFDGNINITAFGKIVSVAEIKNNASKRLLDIISKNGLDMATLTNQFVMNQTNMLINNYAMGLEKNLRTTLSNNLSQNDIDIAKNAYNNYLNSHNKPSLLDYGIWEVYLIKATDEAYRAVKNSK